MMRNKEAGNMFNIIDGISSAYTVKDLIYDLAGFVEKIGNAENIYDFLKTAVI